MGKKEDELEKGKEAPKEDTSDQELVPSEDKFDQEGNKVAEEPDKKETPPEDGKGDDEESPPKPSDTKKYKYTSMDDYDKAYHEAEKKMHESTSEAAALRKRVAQLEKPPEKPSLTVDDKIRDMTKRTVKEINSLSLEYDASGKATKESIERKEEESAFLWAKLQSEIADAKYEERAKRQETERSVVVRTYEAAQKEGLKTDEELRILGYEYSKTDSSLSADDRIEKAIENTKGLLAKVRDGWIKDQEKDKKEKDSLKVLGGGSRNRPTDGGKGKETSKPSDMSSALEDIKKKRTVKKDDLLG